MFCKILSGKSKYIPYTIAVFVIFSLLMAKSLVSYKHVTEIKRDVSQKTYNSTLGRVSYLISI